MSVYGDKEILMKYVKMKFPRYTASIPGEYQHGWHPPFDNVVPEVVVGTDGLSYTRKTTCKQFVARQDQKETLLNAGYTMVESIGMPIVYLEKPKVERIANTLLIMPIHTLVERLEVDDGKSYLQHIKPQLRKFNKITLCLHEQCKKKGQWSALYNIVDEIVIGAIKDDPLTHYRLSNLWASYEFVTSNWFGSHIAYAAYFGAKVSVVGPPVQFPREDFKPLTLYKNCTTCLDHLESVYKNKLYENNFPQFMVDIRSATNQQEWAAFQLGEQCKRAPIEIRRLFGWSYKQFLYRIMSKVIRWPVRKLRSIYYKIRELTNLVYSFMRFFKIWGLFNIIQLRRARQLKHGNTLLRINNHKLSIRNGSTDVDVCLQHFKRRELLDIHYPQVVSTIIDLGANIGISVAVFRYLFPNAHILAVEMDEQNFHLLNLNTVYDKNVKLVKAAIFSHSGKVAQIDVGEGEWAYRVGNTDEKEINAVNSYTFEKLCELNKIELIDVLKMDIEGAEAEVLKASWANIFKITKLLILEIHDWIPNCAETVDKIIKKAQLTFNLKISKHGEFTLITNLDLVN